MRTRSPGDSWARSTATRRTSLAGSANRSPSPSTSSSDRNAAESPDGYIRGVGRAWKIGSVGGVAIRVDSSWVFIAILITYSLWLRYSTPFHGLSNSTALWLAVFGGVLFFGSVLI